MTVWSKTPFGLLHPSGECRIVKAEKGEPGFVGWKLLVGGQHVSTHRRLRDAKEAGEEIARWGAVRASNREDEPGDV